MKAKYLLIPALLVLAACQSMEMEDPAASREPLAAADSVFTLVIHATKDMDTKGLNLDGETLNTYWRSGETVSVFRGASCLGSLGVSPGAGTYPTTATLTGSINVSNLAVNDQLTLLLPRETWDYTGQDGTLATLQDQYDYALATVTVDQINGSEVSASSTAVFKNRQSIYRFSFTSGSALSVKGFTLSSANEGLVRSFAFGAGSLTPAPGSLSVTPASATTDPLFVSICNQSTVEDTYSFIITGGDDALYMATKAIPATVLDTPGKFISATISATQPSFAPVDNSSINTSSAVL